MLRLRDARGRAIVLSDEPRRIVSLVPSDTYTLARLGVGDRLVGRTEYCIAPADLVAAVPAVGGTKSADVDAIVALEPDLVVMNQEENRRIDVERLEDAGVRVLVSFPKTVEEGLEHAEGLARLFPSVDNRARLGDARAVHARHARRQARPVPAFVPIWMDPLMTVHAGTFISDVVELVGGRNVFSDRERRYPLGADLGRRPAVDPGERDTRYPRVTLAEVTARAPELVLLPDEPHPFSEADAAVFRALPTAARVCFCDGKDLMWYGLRALEGLDRLAALVAAE
jgi:ABC-type Fe3+-hydroxamate transport system substrate-binding protein